MKTTRFTSDESQIETIYGPTSLYAKGRNSTTPTTDQVFSSGTDHLVATTTGSNDAGYAASLTIGLASYG